MKIKFVNQNIKNNNNFLNMKNKELLGNKKEII